MRCCAACNSLAGTTSSSEATAVLAAFRQQMLPPLDLRSRNAEFTTQLRRHADLPTQQPLNLFSLELRRIPPVRPAPLRSCAIAPILRLLDSECATS